MSAEQVFKTLVARGDKHGVCLAVVPANCGLDLSSSFADLGAYRERPDARNSLRRVVRHRAHSPGIRGRDVV